MPNFPPPPMLPESVAALRSAHAHVAFEALRRAAGLGMAEAAVYVQEGNLDRLIAHCNETYHSLPTATQKAVVWERNRLLTGADRG